MRCPVCADVPPTTPSASSRRPPGRGPYGVPSPATNSMFMRTVGARCAVNGRMVDAGRDPPGTFAARKSCRVGGRPHSARRLR